MTNTGVFSIQLHHDGLAHQVAQGQGPSGPLLRGYIAGPENSLVPTAIQAVLSQTEPRGPLIFHGPTGSGKTLLTQALASAWKIRHPQERAVITTGADFARDYAMAVREDRLPEQRDHWREARLFVIDDLTRLAGKKPAQNELAATIDALLDQYALVVVTCRTAPLDIKKMARRLVSRLNGGLVIPLVPPGFEARCVILQELAQQRNVKLSARAARVLAESLPFTVPALLHALIEVSTTRTGARVAVTRESARRYIEERFPRPEITLTGITSATARHFKLKVGDLRGATRRQAVVRARSLGMYLARHLLGISYKQIGQHFGGRDHTTVMHNCRKVEQLMQTDPLIRQAVEEIGRSLATG